MKRRLFYPVKECFLTVQGEGAYAGARAVFLRFAGCNVWSGRERDRAKDTAKGCCAAWCDTDFRGTDGVNGGSYSAKDLAGLVKRLWGEGEGIVVCTGGEPSLVLDEPLVVEMHFLGMRVHVETNGSNPLPNNVDWVTLSPKPPMPVVPQRYSEVKVVVPAVAPDSYMNMATLRFVQPLDSKDPAVNAANLQTALAYVMDHPGWRLGSQAHKLWGVP